MTAGETRVTVVVITRDRRAELLRTLDHMATLDDAASIIVVDNASSDGSADAVARAHPEVRLIRADRNLAALGRNLAVERVSTPYVAFCDDDTRWRPGALRRAADQLDAHPGLGTVTGRILVAPGLAEDPITPELRHSPLPRPDWLPGPALLGILAAATMVRTSAFRQVGGFHERMWFGGEEELFALDLAAAGWRLCFDEAVVIHHEPSRERDSRRRRQLGIRNTLWTLALRRPWSSVLRRARQVLGSAPNDRYTLAAMAEAVRGLPGLLRYRRVVPPPVEAGLCLLEDSQRRSRARRYVG